MFLSQYRQTPLDLAVNQFTLTYKGADCETARHHLVLTLRQQDSHPQYPTVVHLKETKYK